MIKKILSIAIAVYFMFMMYAMPVNANVTSDINGDGKVSYLDVLLVKKNIFDIIPRNAFEFDLNNDNTVNVLDLLIVKSECLKEIPVDIPTEPTKVEDEFGVDWEIAERAKNFVISPGCSDYEYTQAERLFLEVINSYKHNTLGYNSASIVSTYDAWQTYFSDRFLRHLDRNGIIMHSILGSRGVCGTTEIITVQLNSMTVWEAFCSFMHSPDHRSAIEDYELQAQDVLITFFAGQENNAVYCLVNFRVATAWSSWYGDAIENFEAFLSSEIRLDSNGYYCSDVDIAKYNFDINTCNYKYDDMRRAKFIIDCSLSGKRLNSWWNAEVEAAANTIFYGFSDSLINGQDDNAIWGKEDDEILENYLSAMEYSWGIDAWID